MLPSTQDYKIALMIGADSFRTLENVEVVMSPLYPDEPWYSTGGLAIVFKIKMGDTTYALKCFHKESPERQYRLQRIAEYIKQNPSPFWVEFDYLENELWVESNGEGQGYPVVLMEWIEGKTLDNYLEDLCTYEEDTTPPRKKRALKNLYFHFCSLIEWLLFTPVAHGDLKHDNIIVLPSGHLKLIDYDGMYIPEFEGREATELGSPCYQHPERTKTYFNDRLDEFSMLVILTTLYAVYDDPEIFRKHYNGDGILFSDKDLRDCYESELLKSLLRSKNEHLELLSKLLCRFQSISTLVQLKEVFDNEDWSEFKKRQAEIRYNEEIVLQELLWKFRGWPGYEMILNYKNKINFTNKISGNILAYYGSNELSKNYRFIWNEDWIDRYERYWEWDTLSGGYYNLFFWNKDLILNYEENLDFGHLSGNACVSWTPELIDKYKNRWWWSALSENESLPWDEHLIEKYRDRWDWSNLFGNNGIKWSKYLLEKYEDKFEENGFNLSENVRFISSTKLVDEYSDRLIWESVSSCSPIFAEKKLIEYYKNSISWVGLAKNEYVPWSEDLIRSFEDRWDHQCWVELSQNTSISWSEDLIRSFEDKWVWRKLSINPSIPWSENLIQSFENKWGWGVEIDYNLIPGIGVEDFSCLSNNVWLPWTPQLIEKFKDRWDWYSLSGNISLPWSEDLINRYRSHWYWRRLGKADQYAADTIYSNTLSSNSSIPWSPSLLKKEIFYWDWKEISKNKAIPWTNELVSDILDYLASLSNYSDSWDLKRIGEITKEIKYYIKYNNP